MVAIPSGTIIIISKQLDHKTVDIQAVDSLIVLISPVYYN